MALSADEKKLLHEIHASSVESAAILKDMVKPMLDAHERKIAWHGRMLISWHAVIFASGCVLAFFRDPLVGFMRRLVG